VTVNSSYTYDLFISYAKEDVYWAEGYLLSLIARTKLRYTTPKDFRIGEPLVGEIERSVLSSKYTLIVASQAYLNDQWSGLTDQFVLYLSTEQRKNRIIPILFEAVNLPLSIDFRTRLDFTEEKNWESESQRLLQFLDTEESQSPDLVPCPYPGMISFKSENASVFFGRENEVLQVLNALRIQHILYVIGASGSGKSSLVFGGVLPALKSTTLFAPDYWIIKEMRPGHLPDDRLKELLSTGEEITDDTISQIISNSPKGKKILLVIDQFEEVFTLASKEQSALFLKKLLFVKKNPSCFVLVTMRAAFYQDLLNSALWPVNPPERLELTSLTSDALEQAITGPAKQVDVYLEPALVQRILSDAASEPGVLPLLQELMILLWEKRANNLIGLSSYKALGKNGLGVAISRSADNTFYNLTKQQQQIAKRIFIRLIQFGEGRPDTRRQQPLTALLHIDDNAEDFNICIGTLVNNRLLTFDGEENQSNIDISHESLIESWPLLSNWIREERDAEQARRRIQLKADEWIRLGKANGGLLDAVEIAEADTWLASTGAATTGSSTQINELVQASKKYLSAIEQEKINVQKRHNEKLRKRAWILGCALLTTGIAFLFAIVQLRISNSRRMAAEALKPNSLLAQSLQLNIDAIHLSDNQDTRSSLLSNLQQLSQVYKILPTPPGFAWKVKMSPDGQTAAAAHTGGIISLWDIKSGKQVGELKNASRKAIYSIDYNKDGTVLVSGGADGMLIRWNTRTLKPIDTLLNDANKPVIYVACSPDERYVAAGYGDNELSVFDLQEHSTRHDLQFHTSAVYCLSFSPTAPILASGSSDNSVVLWDLRSYKRIGHPLTENIGPIRAVCFSPDGKMLACGSDDDDINLVLYDVEKQQRLGYDFAGHTAAVLDIAFTKTGDTMYTCSTDNSIIAWDMNANGQLRTLNAHWAQINSISISRDGARLLSASWDNSLILWDLNNISVLGQIIDSSAYTINDIKIDQHDNTIYFSDVDGNIVKRNNSGTREVRGYQHQNLPGAMYKFIFRKETNHLYSSQNSGDVSYWDMSTKKILGRSPKLHKTPIVNIALNNTETILATGSSDGIVTLFNLQSGKIQGSLLQPHRGKIISLSFNRNGNLLAIGCESNTVMIWDLTLSKFIHSLVANGYIRNCIFSPDGKVLAVGHTEPDLAGIELYSTDSFKLITSIKPDLPNDAFKTTFSSNSDVLFCAGAGRTLQYALSGKLLSAIDDEMAREPFETALSPDNKWIATGMRNKIKIARVDESHVDYIDARAEVSGLVFINDSSFAYTINDSAIAIYNCLQKRKESELLDDFDAYIIASVIDVSLNKAFFAGEDGKIRICTITGIPKMETIVASKQSLRTLAINKKKDMLVTGGLDSILHLYSLSNPAKMLQSIPINDVITAVSFNKDGTLLAVGTTTGELSLYNTSSFKKTATFEGNTRIIWDLSFKNDILATASTDRLIYLWNVSTKKQSGLPLTAHANAVRRLAFSPDGQFLASGGDDNSINLWDFKRNRRFGRSFKATGVVRSLEFSPDGEYLYSGDSKGKLIRWTLNYKDWIAKATFITN